MKIYKVGGAIRDRVLGLSVVDTDWVVVGGTVDEMLAQGYKSVGKDFPVFLHPKTNEEYALARTERKSAPGYKGFQVHADQDVTLEEDLLRRDLTVNAIAEDNDGVLIDPFNGLADIEARILRHVSPAFAEDPVRILRIARFQARFAHLGFSIADDTMDLMRAMVVAGEVDALVPERVWVELARALGGPEPTVFIEVLRSCGALAVLFPELNALFGVPQDTKYHPEVDTGVHTLLVLAQAVILSEDKAVRFAALMHDLGKGTTPQSQWPSHSGHEQRSFELLKGLCKRYKVPKAYSELALLAARYHGDVHRMEEWDSEAIIGLLERLDAYRRPDRFEDFLLVCLADSQGRPGFETAAYPQAVLLRQAQVVSRDVAVAPLLEAGYSGKALATKIREQRLSAVAPLLA